MICFFFSRLLRDCSGFGAMELGIASPFLFLLSLGMIDASMLVGKKIEFEQAAQRTTDYALAVRPNSSDGARYRTEAAAAAGVQEADVTVEIYRTCDGTRAAQFDGACTVGQTTARYVSIAITKPIATHFDWSGLGRALGIQAFAQTVSVKGDSLVRFQ